RQPPPSGRLRRLEPGCLALLLVIGAVDDVCLRRLVALLPHQVLLDDVLDVLDVRVELSEAPVDLLDDRIHQAGQGVAGEAVAGCLQRAGDSGLDALALEPDQVTGSLDDLGRGHDVGDSWNEPSAGAVSGEGWTI